MTPENPLLSSPDYQRNLGMPAKDAAMLDFRFWVRYSICHPIGGH